MRLEEDDIGWANQVLERFLREEFPGVAQLRAQCRVARLERIVLDGQLAFYIDVAGEIALAEVRTRVPVDATGVDADGVGVNCLLHVVDGKLNELEVYRDDLGVILRLPLPATLTIDSGSGRVG